MTSVIVRVNIGRRAHVVAFGSRTQQIAGAVVLLLGSYLVAGLLNAAPIAESSLRGPYRKNLVVVLAPPTGVAPGTDVYVPPPAPAPAPTQPVRPRLSAL